MWLLSKLPVFQAVNTWCPNFRTLTVRFIQMIDESEKGLRRSGLCIAMALYCPRKGTVVPS